ncbi:MFS transporter [Cryptosporangium phraense]|uniref:Multidrug efflux pump Tap n=1 Tax=Cryptosporangium phraense TaxID=2593070 RepID=A0A545AHC9_9ACTN|nr:MFS transporter [Cryptosporangium phraense]TQS40670.1 MFS transporter [Cryptosporangium phraense]
MEMLTLVRKNRTLRRLLAALAVSQVGDWLYNLALLAFVYDRTHSVGWTAATTAARVIPIVLLTPLGGALADRYDRRGLMIASDVVRMATMGLLAVVALAGLPVVLAPVLAALATVASTVYPPAVAASVPRMVDEADLAPANAARSAIASASVLIGPAGGAVLLLAGSPAVAFLINAATFGLSALLLVGLRLGSSPGSAGAGGLVTEMREGLGALRANRAAVWLIGADVLCSLLYGGQTVLFLLLGRQLGWGDAGYGVLLAGVGVGGLLGAVIVARLGVDRQTRGAIAVVLMLVAVAAAGLAVAPVMVVAVVLAAAVSAGSMVVEIVVDTVLARTLDEAVLARAYGFSYPAAIAGIVAGSLVAAPLAGAFGLAGALAVPAVLIGGYALLLGVVATRPAARPVAAPVPVAGPGPAVGRAVVRYPAGPSAEWSGTWRPPVPAPSPAPGPSSAPGRGPVVGRVAVQPAA